MTQTESYYKILQVNYGAEMSDITASYRRLCKLYHPDVNSSPAAEEIMKQINLAYAALCGVRAQRNLSERRRGADILRAQACIQEYFAALNKGDYTLAYNMLSDYDRQYVTAHSFCLWREAVQRLFVMRGFSVRSTGGIFSNELADGSKVPAARHFVTITEKNTVSQTVEEYKTTKLAILEHGQWHVFLGYRDLSEIAKLFESLSAEQERGAMTRHWEEYCKDTCRWLNMLSRSGFLKRAQTEIYRFRRYRQQLTVACFRVKPVSTQASGDIIDDAIEWTARTLGELLRETDIIGYLGNGVFCVLFVELRKRNAEMITRRVANKLKTSVQKRLRMSIYTDSSYEIYEGGNLDEYIDRCAGFCG